MATADTQHERQLKQDTSSAQEQPSSSDDSSRIFKINMIAYVALMVIFYGIFVVYAVIPGIASWLSTR